MDYIYWYKKMPASKIIVGKKYQSSQVLAATVTTTTKTELPLTYQHGSSDNHDNKHGGRVIQHGTSFHLSLNDSSSSQRRPNSNVTLSTGTDDPLLAQRARLHPVDILRRPDHGHLRPELVPVWRQPLLWRKRRREHLQRRREQRGAHHDLERLHGLQQRLHARELL